MMYCHWNYRKSRSMIARAHAPPPPTAAGLSFPAHPAAEGYSARSLQLLALRGGFVTLRSVLPCSTAGDPA